jgi:hypothetical protein
MTTKHHEFPKMLYHGHDKPVTVHNQDEQDALGKGWHEKPVKAIEYEATGEVAEAKVPVQDIHANEKTGADSKFGAEPVHGVEKVAVAKKTK